MTLLRTAASAAIVIAVTANVGFAAVRNRDPIQRDATLSQEGLGVMARATPHARTAVITPVGGSRSYRQLVPRDIGCGVEDRQNLLQLYAVYLVRVDAAGTIRNRILLGTACINPGEADDRPSVPPPPTVAEIRDAVPLPHLDIHTSPIERGLTGLETWFWCNADTTRTVTVGIRGYEVTAHAHVTGYQWITGDGHTYSSKTCGQQPDPDGTGYGAAARHTYETKDFYDLELHATWSGSYSFTGHGRSRSGDLEGVTVASTRRYPVWEVRTVLTD